MKKLSILILVFGLLSLYSCKKDETKVVLSYFNAASITAPTSGSGFILTKEKKDSLMCTFTWTTANYNLTDIVPPTYVLEMDTMGGNFVKPRTLKSSQDLTFAIAVSSMNDIIVGPYGGEGDKLSTFQFRVRASLSDNNPATNNVSAVITLDITPYSSVVIVSPIYLLGAATSAGWDNKKALEMTHIGEAGEFAIVEHLKAGTDMFIKFIADLGAWAPQWGTDAAGTSEAGALVYRPTEAVPDPPAIPAPALEGDYRIVADTALMTYSIAWTSSELYLVGDGCDAGWTPANGIAFTKVSPGIFTLTTTLKAGGLKFLETTTGWAPQWGTDATGTSSDGPLVYRPTESVPDPSNIVSPGNGTYNISLNLATMKYTIKAK
jgi:hypothetical protein